MVTIRLNRDEVRFFNEVVQIYSRERIFYRTERPALIDAFTGGERREFRYHANPWLDGFFEEAIAFPYEPTPKFGRSFF